MHFQVPQFIEIEDKLIGPFTLRQFLYLAGVFGFGFISFFILNFTAWFMLMLPIAAIGLAFAFFKPNNQPMEKIVVAAFQFFWNPRIYFWQRKEKTTRVDLRGDFKPKAPQIDAVAVKKEKARLSDNDIRRIASGLDR